MKIIVIGGGASGMMAAYRAGQLGHEVLLLEKNGKLGSKVYITGNGRCNLTNACKKEEFFNNVVTNSKFVYSAFNSFDNFDIIDFFKECDLETKIEKDNKVFPITNHSLDIINVFKKKFREYNIKVLFNQRVTKLIIVDGICKGVKVGNQEYYSDYIILATGGLSYPITGSNGDGYRLLSDYHQITELLPSLSPLLIKDKWVLDLQGVSLQNIVCRVVVNSKRIFVTSGDILFTHFGLSGPAILKASAYCTKPISQNKTVELMLDLNPNLTLEEIDKRLITLIKDNQNKKVSNILSSLVPHRLIPVILAKANVLKDTYCHDLKKEQRIVLGKLSKELVVGVEGIKGFNLAHITQGGVKIKEINPSTMDSKLIKGLKIVGEVLDVDGLTGGFNLQIAWSTGYLAASTLD